MKILVVNNYYPEHIGGIEFVAYNLVSLFRKRNSVHWMACDVKQNPHQLLDGDIPIKALNFTESRLGFPYPIPVLTSLLTIIREVYWCDIIHLHDCLYAVNVIVFITSRIFNKPVLITQHVSPIPYLQAYKKVLQSIAYRTIGKVVLEHSEEVVFISPRILHWFSMRLNFTRKPILIMNGVDSDLFYPCPEKERKEIRKRLGLPDQLPVLLFVGRFTGKKGLNIIKQIAEQRTNYYWVLIGRADNLNPQSWNLPNVRVIPPLSQNMLRDYYVAADMLVLPSVGEGIPLVVQEAMSCGTPVAVSEEVYKYLPNAPLLKMKSLRSHDLVSTIDRFLLNLKEIPSWRIRASKYAKKNWRWDVVAQRYEELFREINNRTAV